MSDDLRQRYAEALAAKFTQPIPRCDKWGENEWVENPEPADRVGQVPVVMLIADDGRPSFRMPTCAELAEAVAGTRDEELERLRTIEAEVPAMVQKIRGLQIALNEETSARMASGRDAAEWRERAEKAEPSAATAEATISRVRDLADVYELNAGTVDGVAARNFFELFAAELHDALNPPPALLAEEETGRHVEP
jgi:hypothetical protein